MRWQGLFFTLLFMRFGTLFGAPNEPKTRLRDLAKSTIIKYYALDGSSDGFLRPDAKRCRVWCQALQGRIPKNTRSDAKLPWKSRQRTWKRLSTQNQLVNDLPFTTNTHTNPDRSCAKQTCTLLPRDPAKLSYVTPIVSEPDFVCKPHFAVCNQSFRVRTLSLVAQLSSHRTSSNEDNDGSQPSNQNWRSCTFSSQTQDSTKRVHWFC